MLETDVFPLIEDDSGVGSLGASAALITTSARTRREARAALTNASHAILAIFTLEIVIKIGALCPTPRRFFASSWNRFDFVIVGLSYLGYAIDLSSVTVLRLLRLLRVVKLMHSYPALRSVTQSLLCACGDVTCVRARAAAFGRVVVARLLACRRR